jgi:anti-sigma factor RsiW
MLLWDDWVDTPFCRTPRRLERLAAFIDGALERAELRRVYAHARACEECRRVLAEARALLATEDATRQV